MWQHKNSNVLEENNSLFGCAASSSFYSARLIFTIILSPFSRGSNRKQFGPAIWTCPSVPTSIPTTLKFHYKSLVWRNAGRQTTTASSIWRKRPNHDAIKYKLCIEKSPVNTQNVNLFLRIINGFDRTDNSKRKKNVSRSLQRASPGTTKRREWESDRSPTISWWRLNN